jgi:hypothetical protein
MQRPLAASSSAGFGWNFLRLWVATTTAGWAVGFLPAIFAITGALYTGAHYNPNIAATVLASAFVNLLLILASGAVTGIGQAFALTHHTGEHGANDWFVRTLISMTLGWILAWIVVISMFWNNRSDRPETWLLGALVLGAGVGLITGIAQWRLLRAVTPNAGWWIIVSTISWLAASFMFWLVYGLSGGPFHDIVVYYYDGFPPPSPDALTAWPAMLAGWLAGGLLLGLVTGVAMKRLMGSTTSLTVE